MTDQPIRPRFGQLTRSNGEQIPLVFHPTDDPTVFVGVRADTEEPVEAGKGDSFTVDVLGPGQQVQIAVRRAGR